MFRLVVKNLREERGISQYQLANDLGVAQSTVGMWESGRREPGFDATQKLADYFDVSIDYLLGRTQQKKPTPNERDGLLEAIRSDPRKLDVARLIFSLDEQGLAKLEKLFDIVQEK